MNFKDLELMHILGETENLSKASRKLYVSQPTLSSRIKKVEERLNIKIFDRKYHGIKLTKEGEMVVDFARKCLDEYRRLETEIGNMQKQTSGKIRIGVSNYIAINLLPDMLQNFSADFPEVDITIVSDWSSEVFQQLNNGNIDLAIIKGEHGWHGKKTFLFDERVYIVSPWPFNLKDLADLPRIDYVSDRQMKAVIDGWWMENFKIHPNVKLTVNQVNTCRSLIENGMGYSIVVESALPKNKEVFIEPIKDAEDKDIKRPTHVFYPEGYSDSKALKAVVDFIIHNYSVIGSGALR